MPDDPVKLAGVWMTPREATEVEAERQHIFGDPILRLLRVRTPSDLRRFVGELFHAVEYDQSAWAAGVISPAPRETDRAFRMQVLIPLAVASLALTAGVLWTLAALDNATILSRVAQAASITLCALLWIALAVAMRIYKVRSMHLRQCRHAMQNLGWRICRTCGYIIGKQGPPICPECGSEYERSDGLSRERE